MKLPLYIPDQPFGEVGFVLEVSPTDRRFRVTSVWPTTRPEPLFALQAVLSRKCFGTTSLLRAYISGMRIRFALALLSLWVVLACDFSRASDLVLVGAKIYPSPTEPPIDNGSILVHDGRILAVGPSATIKIPARRESY
jgi:hypothetical protein